VTSDLDGQLALDIEGMIHEAAVEAAPEWKGAPLQFTTNYYSPADLDAAFEYWQFLRKLGNSHTQSRMGHRAIAVPGGFELRDHLRALHRRPALRAVEAPRAPRRLLRRR
jgi:hypothetical protein